MCQIHSACASSFPRSSTIGLVAPSLNLVVYVCICAGTDGNVSGEGDFPAGLFLDGGVCGIATVARVFDAAPESIMAKVARRVSMALKTEGSEMACWIGVGIFIAGSLMHVLQRSCPHFVQVFSFSLKRDWQVSQVHLTRRLGFFHILSRRGGGAS